MMGEDGKCVRCEGVEEEGVCDGCSATGHVATSPQEVCLSDRAVINMSGLIL